MCTCVVAGKTSLEPTLLLHFIGGVFGVNTDHCCYFVSDFFYHCRSKHVTIK